MILFSEWLGLKATSEKDAKMTLFIPRLNRLRLYYVATMPSGYVD